MKIVSQRDRTGCGLACVAMVTGQTYYQVRRKYHVNHKVNKIAFDYSTNARDLHNLSELVSPKMISVKKWDTIPDFAIVAIGNRKSGGWHWVVFERKDGIGVFYDPWKVKVRTDFGRVNLKAYVPIKGKKRR